MKDAWSAPAVLWRLGQLDARVEPLSATDGRNALLPALRRCLRCALPLMLVEEHSVVVARRDGSSYVIHGVCANCVTACHADADQAMKAATA